MNKWFCLCNLLFDWVYVAHADNVFCEEIEHVANATSVSITYKFLN